MKAFANGCDTYIAETLEQAVSDWEQFTGESINDYDLSEWYECNLDQKMRIWVETEPDRTERIPPGATIEPRDDYTVLATATLRDWVEHNGRGFLCSTEY